MDSNDNEIIELSNGEIVMWTDNKSSLHIKCISKFGDPVELNAEEILELCDILQKCAKRIE